MKNNKKILTFAIVSSASVLALGACSNEEKEPMKIKSLEEQMNVDKEDNFKYRYEIKNKQEESDSKKNKADNSSTEKVITVDRELLYMQYTAFLSDIIILLPDSKNLETYDDYYDFLTFDSKYKSARIYTTQSYLNAMNNINDTSLTEEELKLKVLLQKIYQLEIEFLEFAQSKYDVNQERVVLKTNEDIQTYDKKQNEIISLVKENTQLIRKNLYEYKELEEYDESKPYGHDYENEIEELIESENRGNQKIIQEFKMYFSTMMITPYFMNGKGFEEGLNDIILEINNSYKTIQTMDVYKNDVRFKTYIDDFANVTKGYKELNANSSVKEVDNAMQTILNNIVFVGYKYLTPKFNEMYLNMADETLTLIENDEFHTIFED